MRDNSPAATRCARPISAMGNIDDRFLEAFAPPHSPSSRRRGKMTAILQIIFDALSLGSLYALGALGIALIFGVMRLVNFAHGDYIAFCVFAMLWPSIDATAVVF